MNAIRWMTRGVVALLWLASPAAHATIVVETPFSTGEVQVNSSAGGTSDFGPLNTTGQTVFTTTFGSGFNQLIVDLTDTLFHFGMEETITSNESALTFSKIQFTSSVDLLYEFTGSSEASLGFGASSLEVNFDNGLFFSGQTSLGTLPDGRIIDLVNGGGNSVDFISGSPTGLLQAGQTYELRVQHGFSALGGGFVGHTGWIDLRLTEVPEPGAALLAAIGLAGLASFRAR